MGDGGPIGRVPLRAFTIDVNPLMVLRRIRELVDALLRDLHPIRDGDLASRKSSEILHCFYGHRPSSNFAMDSRCTSSGPSASRSVRELAHPHARGKSPETPPPPGA